MDVTLVDLPASGQPLLERLAQLYGYDFSEFMGMDVGEDGLFTGGKPLATCWTEPWRHPFLLRVDGKIAGFTILDEKSRLTGDPTVADVAEFFVMRKYRRKGVGALAAVRAFSMYRRRWEVRQTAANTAATAFWRRVIGAYTGGAYEETVMDDARWRGTVQTFDGASV
jgi:predicted acetyltransferase